MRGRVRKLVICMAAAACLMGTAAEAGKTSSSFNRAVADTSIRLLRSCMKKSGTGNVLISPQSVLSALSMAENGAAGKTLSQMEKALGGIGVKKYTQELKKLNSRLAGNSSVTYRNANSLWYRKSRVAFREAWLKEMTSSYEAEIYGEAFDDSTVKLVNDWVFGKTNGKIPSIINRIDKSARVLLVNAVYFKGAWADPYSGTVSRTFTNAGGKKKKTAMLEGTEHTYLTLEGGKGFVKPYCGGKVAFAALLPPKGMSAAKYLSKLSGKKWIKAWNKRKTSGVRVRTRMPVFSYDYDISLKGPLKALGIKAAFTSSADFSGMTDKGIQIDDVIHKTFIDVNKDGTEAAAATAVVMKAGSVIMKQKEKKVYLNRPFIYALVDTQTGIPLFIGAVNTL